jgi:chorismate mutase/prephenate dehydratase
LWISEKGKGMNVAFLGPEASFSHEAAMSLFGESASFQAVDSIEDVFVLVERGDCQKGIVPVENSYEGSVGITLDLFYRYDVYIGAEVFKRIRHHLLSRAGNLEDIKYIYSHTQALAQCHSWLENRLKGIPRFEVASTSLAAKMAAGEPGAAAVGSRFAGQKYGLSILAKDIEDHPDNVTRFLEIGKSRPRPMGKDKTSIIFCLGHKPGSLYIALAALAERGVNMTRIESRPMKTKKWEYIFFIDINGHQDDGNIEEALLEMEKNCVFMKRLGSYPVGEDPKDLREE